MTSTNSALVTGATCFIGRELIRRLIEGGVTVTALTRPGSDLTRLGPMLECVNTAVYDGTQKSLDMALENAEADTIFHLAGRYATGHGSDEAIALIDSNIKLGTGLLEAAKKTDTLRFINTGSHFQFYEDDSYRPLSLYAATKQAFQDILEFYRDAEGFKTINLILFETFGAGDWRKKLMAAISEARKNGSELPLTDRDPVMDFVYVDDAIDAFIQADQLLIDDPSCHSGKTYSVSGNERMTISEIIKLFEDVGGKAIKTRPGQFQSPKRIIENPWNGPGLPGWSAKLSLKDGIAKFIKGGAEQET